MGLVKKWQIEKSNTLTLANNLVEIADGAVTPAKLSFGTWEKIGEISVTSSVQSVSFTNLDGNNDKFYMLAYSVKNSDTANSRRYHLRFNDDDGANYYRQYLVANETTVSAGGDADLTYTTFTSVNAGGTVTGVAYIYAVTGENRKHISIAGRGKAVIIWAGSWQNSSSNITKLTIFNADGNYIGAGSRFVLFRISQ